MTNIRRIIAGSLTVIAMVALAAVAIAKNSPDQIIKVTYGRSIDDLPLYVGLEEGFWVKEGLNVELVHLAGETNIIAAALHGDIQAGLLSLPSACHAAFRDIPFKIVAWMGRAHKGTRCGLHADPSAGIKSIQELKGKRIATSGDIVTATFLDQVLTIAGMTLGDVQAIKGIKLDDAMKHEAALRSKGVDVIIA
ncbi:MAG: ABC transporter substrate-binding protein [Pseudomonadota bacterium]